MYSKECYVASAMNIKEEMHFILLLPPCHICAFVKSAHEDGNMNYIVCQNALETRWKLVYVFCVLVFKGDAGSSLKEVVMKIQMISVEAQFHGSIFSFPLKSSPKKAFKNTFSYHINC